MGAAGGGWLFVGSVGHHNGVTVCFLERTQEPGVASQQRGRS